MDLSLRPVNHENLWELTALKVYPSQEDFVASNTVSILEAYTAVSTGKVALPFGIYDGDTPVGFLMLGYDTLDWGEEEPEIAAGNYCLWRFMIDARYQGRGYGRAALEQALCTVRALPCGPARYCWTSYEPENSAAKRLYESFGFRENGQWDGDERIAVLAL